MFCKTKSVYPRGIPAINLDRPLCPFFSCLPLRGTYISSGSWHVCLMPSCAAGERDQYYLPHLVSPTLCIPLHAQHPANITVTLAVIRPEGPNARFGVVHQQVLVDRDPSLSPRYFHPRCHCSLLYSLEELFAYLSEKRAGPHVFIN